MKSADLVFEGKILQAKSFEKDGQIYTEYTAKVYKSLKNAHRSTVHFIGRGGRVGDRIMKHNGATPRVGQIGIFSARKKSGFTKNRLDHNGIISYSVANQKIILPDGSVYDNHEQLYQEFRNHRFTVSIINPVPTFKSSAPNGRTEAKLEITSLVPLNIAGGTQRKLTINGRGFGEKIGKGSIYFTNNKDGGKTKRELMRYWTGSGSVLLNVVSWTDTKIEVYVPSFAGSGAIIVKNHDGETFESLESLTIPYSISSVIVGLGVRPPVVSPPDKINEAQINPDLVNKNGKGGYTLYVDPDFFKNADMLGAFNRALIKWRCATGINIKLESSLKKIEVGYRGVNGLTVVYPEFGDDEISFVEAYYHTCHDGKTKAVRLNEFQIAVNGSKNWNFSENPPASNQLDFESEVLRLLGRVCQLECVNDPNSPMFYKLAPGVMRREITANMLKAAQIIAKQSKEENDCGTAPMVFVEKSACKTSIGSPKARFKAVSDTEFCKSPAKVNFEDLSKNVVSWSWSVKGAKPDASTQQNPTFEFLKSGNYTISLTVKGANGETSTETKTDFIKIGAQDITLNLGDDITICQNKKVTLDAGNPGATYKWSNGATTQKLTTGIPGKYSVIVTKGGCSKTDDITIKLDPSSVVDAGENAKICQGSSIQLQATGGKGGFRWEPAHGLSDPNIANPIASPDSTIIYRVYADSLGGCGQIYDSIRITVGDFPKVTGLPESREVVLCGKNPFTYLNAYSDEQGLKYEWSNGSQDSYTQIFEAGIYTLKVTSPSGCELRDTVKVIKVDEIKLKVTSDTSLCKGEKGVLLKVKGASFYSWEPGESIKQYYGSSVLVNPKTTTTYTVTGRLRGNSECKPGKAKVTVRVLPKPTLELGKDITTCENKATLDAQNEGGLFQWSDGSQTQKITVNKPGMYFVTVTPKGCAEPLYDSVKVTFAFSTIDLGKDTVRVCNTKSWKLSVPKSTNPVVWSDGSTGSELFVTASGKYTVRVENAECGGVLTDTIMVLFPKLESFLPPKIVACKQPVSIDASGNTPNPDAMYEWQTGETTPAINVSKAGSYRVKITSKTCPNQILLDTVDVVFSKNLKLDLGDETILGCDSVTLDTNVEDASYAWSDGSTGKTLTVKKSGTYFVSVSNKCGQSLTDQVTVYLFKNSKVDFSYQAEGEAVKFIPTIDSKHQTAFSWSFGDSTKNSTLESPKHVFNRVGTYQVTLNVSSKNCDTTPISITKTVNVTVSGVEEEVIFGKLDIYPNPTKGQIVLRRAKSTESVQIKLTDLSGRVIKLTQLKAGQKQKVIQFEHLPTGMYLLEMNTSMGTITRKIVKE